MQALEDALASYDADRIVIFTHPDDERDYLEDGFVEEAEQRLGRPVIHREVTRG